MNKMQAVDRRGDGGKADEQEATSRRRSAGGSCCRFRWSLLAVGLYWWLTSGATVETDNAAVKQDIVSVSAQVNGPITRSRSRTATM